MHIYVVKIEVREKERKSSTVLAPSFGLREIEGENKEIRVKNKKRFIGKLAILALEYVKIFLGRSLMKDKRHCQKMYRNLISFMLRYNFSDATEIR